MAHRWFRKIHVSSKARTYVNALTHAGREAFCDLLIKLDADPFSNSTPVLIDGKAVLREARFASHRAIFQFDFSVRPNGQIRIVVCGRR